MLTCGPGDGLGRVVSDGHAGYNATSLGERPHQAKVQTKAELRVADAAQACHWTVSNLKRWLLGTHGGAVRPTYLQPYLDEHAFRHNRRKTAGVARIAARVIERVVAHPPITLDELVHRARRSPWFNPPPDCPSPEGAA